MNLHSEIKLNAGETAKSICDVVNAQVKEKILCLLPLPSPAMIQEIIKRTYGQDLHITSVSGDHENITCSFAGGQVLIVRMTGDSLDNHQKVLSHTMNKAKPGDFIILKSYDLSKGRCFPYHSAFERFMEILSMYNQVKKHPVTYEELLQLTKDHNETFIQMGVPVKFPSGFKSLPPELLECLRACIETTDAIQMDEFDTVLAELRRMGRDPEVTMRLFTLNRIIFKR